MMKLTIFVYANILRTRPLKILRWYSIGGDKCLGWTAKVKKRVLILCTGNSCRSQMAEGFLRHYGGEKFEVFSAGTHPSRVNNTAIQVMKEVGIDLSGHRSKNVAEFIGQNFDIIITVCDNAKESCPVFPGNGIRLHWPFPDPPHGQGTSLSVLKEFRRVRDLLRDKFKSVAETGVFETTLK